MVSFGDTELAAIMNKRKAHSRSALLHDKANPKREGYSTFDSGASTDYGRSLSAEYESTPQTSIITNIEDSRGRVSISWQNINVFVEIPGPSFFKRLCLSMNESDTSTKKQVLFNGKECVFPYHLRSVQNSDCSLHTEYKMQTRYKVQTADWAKKQTENY